jgi:methyl-accepting chemotaxis protein
MFLSALTAHWQLNRADQLQSNHMDKRVALILEMRQLHVGILESVTALEHDLSPTGIGDGTTASGRQRAREMAQAENAMAMVQATAAGMDLGDDKARLTDLESQFSLLKQLEASVEAPPGNAAAHGRIDDDVESIDDTLERLVHSQTAWTAVETGRLRDANQGVRTTLWSVTLLGALVGGLVSYSLGRRIARSIDLLTQRADSIADGNLTGRNLQFNHGDEVGLLATAMTRMQTRLGTIIGTVAETAGSLTVSAVSMRSASDQIHRGIDQQSQQTQQAATAMQEMSASIAEVSRHTQSAAETARSAAQTARDGGTIVDQMLESMRSIAQAVSETSVTVGFLGEDSRRISQIVTVIDEIARKTNLLALNAAIEAARAGEQGRGFAVVAGEVRRLAESTGQATGEIGAMIQEIQDRTKSAIGSMESGTGTVRQGVATTKLAGEALKRIIGMAEQVDRMIAQIAIAASQQTAAADQSSASLDAIHLLSSDNLKAMATTVAGIESLRGTAVNLEKQVDRFQVVESDVDRAA